jgi:hypothetical protein
MNSESNQIRAIFILEALGRPPEHIKEFLEKIVERIDSEKGVNILSKKINEPTPLKDKKDFFTTFAEIEMEIESMIHLAGLMFKYMPAHIEILSPEKLTMGNNDLSEVFNELTRRLHGYDEITKILQIERNKLTKKLKEFMGESKDSKETKKSKEPKEAEIKEDKKDKKK